MAKKKLTIEEIKFFKEVAKKEYDSIISYYDKVNYYCKPYYARNSLTTDVTKVNQYVTVFILNCIEDFTNYIMNTLMSRGTEWGKAEIDTDLYERANIAKMSKEVLSKNINDINLKLEKATFKLFKYLNNSNYYNQIYSSAWDCISMGLGVVRVNDLKDFNRPFSFQREDVSDCFISENSTGKVAYIFKKHKDFNYLEFKQKFVFANWVDSDKSLERKINFYECVVERDGKYHHILYDESMQQELMYEILEYPPLIAFRFRGHENSSYGIGQGMWCLDYFDTLSELMILDKEHVANTVNPALIGYGDTQLFNSLMVKAGYINYGGLSGTPKSLEVKPVLPPARLEVLDAQINKVKADIEKAFLVNPLGDVADNPDLTATEAQLRSRQFRDTFSGVYERLVIELLEPVFLSTMYILSENKLIDIEDEYIKLSKIKFINDIAEEANFKEVQKLVQVVQLGTILGGQEFPSLLIAKGKLRDWIVKRTGVNVEPLNSNEEIAKLIELAQEQIKLQQQMALEQAKGGTNVSNQGNQGIGETNQVL
ncbi:MAG: portal protein [Cetobacterium sp.]